MKLWFNKNQEEKQPSEEELKKLLSELKSNRKLAPKRMEPIKVIQEKEIKKHPYDKNIPKPERLKEFDLIKDSGFFVRVKYRLMERWHPSKNLMINMEFNNGFHASWLLKEKDGGVIINDRRYIFDHESKYYNLTSKLWCYDFHESFSLPIKRDVDIRGIKDAIKEQYPTVEVATNPDALEEFVRAEIAKSVIKGASMESFFRRLFLVSIINFGILVIFFLYMLFKTGAFSSVKIPGIGG